MSHKHDDPKMEACITECLNCHRTCLHMAMTHCLEAGGKHSDPSHLRLMLNCAEICQTSANFMISGSEMHHLTCGVCAQVCRRCQESCESIEGMEGCAKACSACAQTCQAMAA